jgi:hypothetical protein
MILRMSFLLALTLPLIASSQVPSSIHGRVVDSAGLPLRGITVTLEQPKTTLRQSIKTDKNGIYNFDDLANGQYGLMFEGPGLITERIDNITYRSPYSFTQDLTMYSSVPLIKGNPQEEQGKPLDPERCLSLPTYPEIAGRAAIEGDYEIEMQIEEGGGKKHKNNLRLGDYFGRDYAQERDNSCY